MNLIAEKRPSKLHLTLFAVALLLVILLGSRQLQRASSTKLWVAASSVPAGTQLVPQHLKQIRVAKSAAPPIAVADRSELEGKTLQRSKAAGQPFMEEDFARNPSVDIPWLSDELPPGRVLSTVRLSATPLPVRQLRRGDRFDIVAVSRRGQPQLVGRDAWLMGWINGKPETAPSGRANGLRGMISQASQKPGKTVHRSGIVAFVLGLHPDDVVPVAQAEASGARLTFVLHGREEVASGRQLEIAAPRSTGHIELIAGERREQVEVRP